MEYINQNLSVVTPVIFYLLPLITSITFLICFIIITVYFIKIVKPKRLDLKTLLSDEVANRDLPYRQDLPLVEAELPAKVIRFMGENYKTRIKKEIESFSRLIFFYDSLAWKLGIVLIIILLIAFFKEVQSLLLTLSPFSFNNENNLWNIIIYAIVAVILVLNVAKTLSLYKFFESRILIDTRKNKVRIFSRNKINYYDFDFNISEYSLKIAEDLKSKYSRNIIPFYLMRKDNIEHVIIVYDSIRISNISYSR
ncbi:MAG: hypothetical protein NZ822_01080 [Patescibacteria group bacterium]|nr:hypothetical protein [Patescibacteria group bacterium]